MERDSVVIVSLHTPREKIWGRLLAVAAAGVTIQGLDLNCFEDWMRQVLEALPAAIGLSTVFYPMHRVERIALDEPSGDIPSFTQQFLSRAGLTLLDYLVLPDRPNDRP